MCFSFCLHHSLPHGYHPTPLAALTADDEVSNYFHSSCLSCTAFSCHFLWRWQDLKTWARKKRWGLPAIQNKHIHTSDRHHLSFKDVKAGFGYGCSFWTPSFSGSINKQLYDLGWCSFDMQVMLSLLGKNPWIAVCPYMSIHTVYLHWTMLLDTALLLGVSSLATPYFNYRANNRMGGLQSCSYQQFSVQQGLPL